MIAEDPNSAMFLISKYLGYILSMSHIMNIKLKYSARLKKIFPCHSTYDRHLVTYQFGPINSLFL